MKKIILILTLLFAVRTFANQTPPKNAIRAPEESNEPVQLNVPQSKFDIDSLNLDFKPPRVFHLELTASTWAPSHLGGASFLNQTTNFSRTQIPQLSLSGWSEGWNFSLFNRAPLNIAPKLGFSFAQFQRTGELDINGSGQPISQKMNLYSLFLGVELAPQKEYFDHLQVFLDLGVVPAWAQASSSQFNEGESTVYWGFKETLGAAWNFSKVGSNMGGDVAAEIGIETTQSLNGTDFSDTGILTGIRLGL